MARVHVCVCVYIMQPFTFTEWDLTESIVLKKGY